MLNAATTMMRSTIRNIIRFSISTARKNVAFCRVQSVAKYSGPRKRTSSLATLRRLEQVLQAQPHAGHVGAEQEQPLGILDVHEREPRVELVVIDLEDAHDGELPHPRQ